MRVTLRRILESDLETFYEHQLDPEAARMAAFPSREREPFMAHWAKIFTLGDVVNRTILLGDEIAGNIVCFEQGGVRQIGYWIGREFWGRGVATEALRQFVPLIEERPLYAFVAVDNVGSIRVLEKCGFEPDPESPRHVAEDGVEELLMRRDD